MTSFIDLEKTDGIAFPARAYNFLPQKAKAARSMRTTSAKPYEVVEGKPPFPARKNAANPGGRLPLRMRCVFAAYNFDSTYCNTGKFTAQSQNRASFVRNREEYVPRSERRESGKIWGEELF